MLMSGRWCVLVSLLFASGVSLGAPKQAGAAKKPTMEELVAEQQKAFAMSANARIMPANEWFVETAYQQHSDDDLVASRWITQIDHGRMNQRAANY